jgi:PAS domain S-box-containing protein
MTNPPDTRLIIDAPAIESARFQPQLDHDRFFDLSLDLLAVANFEGYFLRVNPAWEETLGFTAAELMAQPYLDLIHPADRAATRSAAQGLSQGAVAIRFENRYRTKDGSYRWLSWSARPYDEQNLVYAVAHDITARKQAQAELEARNRELDSFVHIVSHDLKAPLRGIANLSQWIEDDLEGSLLSETRSQMALLRSRVNRMAATIDGLLDYACVGRTADTITLVSVAELLAETIDSLAPPPAFTIVVSPHLPTLKTNRLLLSQVFANLISNSIKHHDRSDGKIDISCEEYGDLYRFVVADDGPGIAPQHHDKIFTIFQAVNRQNSPDSTGIGLSIVKKIVETTGGNIQLESAIGQGATFRFTWPKKCS